MKIFGYLEIDGRRYHAEDVLYALLQQGIVVEVLENQEYSLRINNKLIDPDPELKSQTTNACPFVDDINEIKENLLMLKNRISNGTQNRDTMNTNSRHINNQAARQGKRENLNSLMKRLYDKNDGNDNGNGNSNQFTTNKMLRKIVNRQDQESNKGSQKSTIPYKYLSKPSTCAFCGSKISETTKYCYNCGNEVVKHSKLVDM